MISTGVPYLDRLTGGLKLGDNVVWQVSDGVPVEYFIRSFFSGQDFNATIIYISFNFSPHTIVRRYDYLFEERGAVLVDAFTHGKGNGDPVFLDFYEDPDLDRERFIRIESPRNITTFVGLLNEIETKNRDGSFYIFDSLTGMNELWKDERAVLDFFTFTCPKLYDLNTLAYWILGTEAHTREFMAGIMQTTQIVFSIRSSDMDYYELKIHKLEGRTSRYGTQPSYFKILDRDILFEDRKSADLLMIGEKVKNLRKESRITQAELASSLNLTPGAVSQIENDIITPSLNTLIQLAALFNRPIDYFIGGGSGEGHDRGYIVSRKQLRLSTPSRNMTLHRMFDADGAGIKPFLATISGDKPADGPLLLHKGKEFLSVIEGKLNITIDGDIITLETGDSVLAGVSFITRFQGVKDLECKFIYILF